MWSLNSSEYKSEFERKKLQTKNKKRLKIIEELEFIFIHVVDLKNDYKFLNVFFFFFNNDSIDCTVVIQ